MRLRALLLRPAIATIGLLVLLMLTAQLALAAFVSVQADALLLPQLERKANGAGKATARTLSRAIAAGVPWQQLEGTEAYFNTVLSANPDLAYIILTDHDGNMLVRAGRGGEVIAPEQYVASQREIERRLVTYGDVRVGVDRRFIASHMAQAQDEALLLAAGGALAILAGALFTVGLTFLQPLRHLARLLEGLAGGDFRYRLDGTAFEPINAVTDRINALFQDVTALAAQHGAWARAQPALLHLRSRYRFAEHQAVSWPAEDAAALHALVWIALVGQTCVLTILPALATDLSRLAAPLATYLPLSVGLAAATLTSLVARAWSRNAGARRPACAGALLSAIAMGTAALIPDYRVLMLAYLLDGVGCGILLAALARWSRGWNARRPTAVWASMLAAAAGPLFGAQVAHAVSDAAAFALSALAMLGVAVLALMLIAPARPVAHFGALGWQS